MAISINFNHPATVQLLALRMTRFLLASLLLLLSPLLSAKVFLVDTEAGRDKTGWAESSQDGQDYTRCHPDCGQSKPKDCLYNSVKWTKKNNAMEKRQEARGRKGKKVFENGGFWIMGHDARPLPKGTNRFCCEHIWWRWSGGRKGELVENLGSCKKSVLEMQLQLKKREAEIGA